MSSPNLPMRQASVRNMASLTELHRTSSSAVSNLGSPVQALGPQKLNSAMRRAPLGRGSKSKSFLVGTTFSYIRSKLLLFLGDTVMDVIDDLLSSDSTNTEISKFLKADGPRRLTFLYQTRSSPLGLGSKSKAPDNVLFLTDLDQAEPEQFTGKCVYFLRLCNSDVRIERLGDDLCCGSILFPFLESMDLLLSELFGTTLRNAPDLDKISKEGREEFFSVFLTTCENTRDTLNGIQGGVELSPLDQSIHDDPRASSHNKLALDDDFMLYLDNLLEEWCRQVEVLLSDNDPASSKVEDEGPGTEVTWWKHRAANLGNVVEQLKGKDAKLVIGVANVAKCKNLKRWKGNDAELTESWNEAKDHVKYLASLEKFLEPLYSGTISQMKDILPGLFSKLRAMNAISRYYNKSPERLTRLLKKISNQTIKTCKVELLRRGKLLDQDPDEVLEKIQSCIGLANDLSFHCNMMNPALLQGRGHGSVSRMRIEAVDSGQNLTAFVDRITKITSLIKTIKQFSALFKAEIEGLEPIVLKLKTAVQNMKNLPYEILDFNNVFFESDHTHFDTEISFIELSLKHFIDKSFEEMHSTDLALRLFGELEAVLDREALKNELQDKYAAIFQYYGEELESVQELYDREKSNPPVPRNVPPVAGKVMWSRHLLTRVEGPMLRFQSCKNLLGSKDESKRIIKIYNKIAKTLIYYETLWLRAWNSSIDTCKAGLHATLLVRHPETENSLCVNFDREIISLIREGKALQRLGVVLPEIAQTIIAQESKFKMYYERLSLFVQEYNIIISRPAPSLKLVMTQHFEELERIIRPGMTALTWQSMNIDAYLHRIYNILQRLDDMISKVQGTIAFNVDKKLKQVSRMDLVRFPEGKKSTLEEFVSNQEEYIETSMNVIIKEANDISYALSQVVSWLQGFAMESGDESPVEQALKDQFWNYYSQQFYLAILKAVKNSFSSIKSRLCSKRNGGFFLVEDPFFNVDVELAIPSVSMQPPMNAIQNAINECAFMVLSSFKSLPALGGNPNDNDSSYYNLIAADRRIVQSVLLLTGALEAVDRQVMDYMKTFNKFEFLWTENKALAYEAFFKRKPTHEDFETELGKYLQIEKDIAAITPVHNIGCLCLRTQSLKYSLKAEAAAWKSLYSKHLHGLAKSALDDQVSYLRDAENTLRTDVTSVDEVRDMLSKLKELQSKESDLDLQFVPIENMYYLLRKYEVRIPKEEIDCLSSLRSSWKDIVALGHVKSTKLAQLQSTFKRDLIRTIKSFSLEVMQFCNDYEMNGPMVAGLAPHEALDRLKKYQALCEEREGKYKVLSEREIMFGIQKTSFPELLRVREELDMLDVLYSLYIRSEQGVSGFYELTMTQVVVRHNIIKTSVSEYLHEMALLPRLLSEWTAYLDMKKTVEDMASIIPILTMLSDAAVRPRHWKQILSTMGNKKLREDKMRLKQFVALGPLQFSSEIEEICKNARKEAKEEMKMKETAEFWTDQTFQLTDYKKKGATLDAKCLSDIIDRVEESLATLSVIQKNRHAEPFLDEVTGWLSKLSSVSEIVQLWSQVQSKWMHMETLFSIPDIASQLESEARRFKKIDASYLKMMARVSDNRHVLTCCYSDQQAKNLLPHILEQLELCESLLVKQLDGKRTSFPRFYFVSDRLLLKMISEGCNSESLDSTVHSVFDDIKYLSCPEDNLELVTTVHAKRGVAEEALVLAEPVEKQREIESFLSDLQSEISRSLRNHIQECRAERHSATISHIVATYPMQVCLLDVQIQWSKDCKDALSRAKVEKNIMVYTSKRNSSTLSDLLALLSSEAIDTDLSRRICTEALIVTQIYQRDRFDILVQNKVMTPSDFDFQKLIRFTWKDDSQDVNVSVAHVSIEYGFEYLGLQDRMVATPQSDRCFVALACALGTGMGATVVGPSGTGKTECIRELGRSTSRYVFTFHGTDLAEANMIEKLLKGLAASGAWGCFNEFSNINGQVLSICAQHMSTVLSALRERRFDFTFSDGEQVYLDNKCGLFITTDENEVGNNLRHIPSLGNLFRSFSMPDIDISVVVFVSLVSYGFKSHSALSITNRIKTLYMLCEDRLSKQSHYDFGIRNLVYVLRAARNLKLASNSELTDLPGIASILRQRNLPRLIPEDITMFLAFLAEVFPGISNYSIRGLEIEQSVRQQAKSDGLAQNSVWIDSILELFEVCNTRQTVIVCGPSCSGKTSMLTTLSRALSSSGLKQMIHRIYPKAVPISQLFGWINLETNRWHDGIFSILWRSRANKQDDTYSWIALDGPIDPMWMENLNSVLDEKILGLPNGDRIAMSTGMRLIFENENLQNASPAVISRTGIFYVPSSALTWESVLSAWLAKFSDERQKQNIKALFDRYIPQILQFIKEHCSPALPIPAVNSCWSLTKLYDGLMRRIENKSEKTMGQITDRLFIFCALWAFAGSLDSVDREKISSFMKASFAQTCPMPTLAHGDTFFDYLVDDVTADWEHWRSRVPDWSFPSDPQEQSFPQLIVPTMDGARTQYLVKALLSQKCHVMFAGASGCAKSSQMLQFALTLDPKKQISQTLSLTGVTSPEILLRGFESVIEKRMGRHYGPAEGKHCIMIVEDVNQTDCDQWGDSSTLEFFRQFICEEGYYSSRSLGEWITVADIQYVSLMTNALSKPYSISDRFKTRFSCFNLTNLLDTTISSVFSKLLGGRLALLGGRNSVVEMAMTLSQATISVWRRLQAQFHPEASKVHHIFELNDVSRVFEGLLRCAVDELSSPEHVIKVWRHECERSFCDKLSTIEDQAAAYEIITSSIRAQISKSNSSSAPMMISDGYLFHSNDVYGDLENTVGAYKPIRDFRAVKEKIKVASQELSMDIIVFDEFIQHVVRMNRVLGSPRGYALLVGDSCSGKGCLAQIAAFLSTTSVINLKYSGNHDAAAAELALRNAYKVAGLRSVTTTLLFSTVKDVHLLERINQFVRAGHFPGLIPPDEVDDVVGEFRSTLGEDEGRRTEALLKQFMASARNHIRIIICLDPFLFEKYWLLFPVLRSNFVVDWVLPWRAETLQGVSQVFFKKYVDEANSDPSYVANFLALIHTVIQEYAQKHPPRQIHIAPRHFLSMIFSFRKLYRQQLRLLKARESEIDAGLRKLDFAGDGVAIMKADLEDKDSVLKYSQATASDLLKDISASTMKTEKKKAEVMNAKNALAEQTAEVQQHRDECDRDLAAAGPALRDAEHAILSITTRDLSALRSVKNLPLAIKLVFDGVLIFLRRPLRNFEAEGNGFRDSYLESAKLMQDPQFLKNLMAFPKDSINDETMELFAPYLDHKDFVLEKMNSASIVAKALFLWIRAVSQHFELARAVMPKINILRMAEAHLSIASGRLEKAVDELNECQGELDDLQAKFEAAVAEKHRLNNHANKVGSKIMSAESLLLSLEVESARWKKESQSFKDEISRLIGDCGMASAMLVYLGQFHSDFRGEILQALSSRIPTNIAFAPDFRLASFYSAKMELRKLEDEGLPNDDGSVENGIITLNAPHPPVLIDPYEQGLRWIKNRESVISVTLTSDNSQSVKNVLEECLTSGKTLIIEDIDEIMNPIISVVLENVFKLEGKAPKALLFGKELDIANSFYLYMTCRIHNPNFPRDFVARTSVVDFSVTVRGLEDQLLAALMQKERPELHRTRLMLLDEVHGNKSRIQELNQVLLKCLAETEGYLLEDQAVINALTNIKSTAQEADESLQRAKDSELRILETYEAFRPIASRGRLLFEVLAEMRLLNRMYQFTLSRFMGIFEVAIESSERSLSIPSRIVAVSSHLTSRVVKYFSREYFEEHKIIFGLLTSHRILCSQDPNHSVEHLRFLIKGSPLIDASVAFMKPREWISDLQWQNCVYLSEIVPVLSPVIESLNKKDNWKFWLEKEAPEIEPTPDLNNLDLFYKVLLIRALREDRIIPAIHGFNGETLGEAYSQQNSVIMDDLYNSSGALSPILCIIRQSSDPTNSIFAIAKKRHVLMEAASLGKGQHTFVLNLISAAASQGTWVLLHNAHLAPDFIALLEHELSKLKTDNLNPGFRLWITTEPHDTFPIGFLLISTKVMFQPPSGIRSTMHSLCSDAVCEEVLGSEDSKGWFRAFYALCYVYSIMHERAKFGPIGFSSPYDFDFSDWNVSVSYMRDHIVDEDSRDDDVSSTLRFILGEVHFGGRVRNDWDRRTVKAYIESFLGNENNGKNLEFFSTLQFPASNTVADFLEAIQQISPTDSSERFGLNSAVDFAYRSDQTQQVLRNLAVFPLDAVQINQAAPQRKEETVALIIRELLTRLDTLKNILKSPVLEAPKQEKPSRNRRMSQETTFVNVNRVKFPTGPQLAVQPLTNFLHQEALLIQNIAIAVQNNLKDLLALITNSGPMNSEMNSLLNNLFDSRVPVGWVKISWTATTLSSWLATLQQRHDQLDKWIASSKLKAYWLGGFMHPRGFLTSLRQEIAKKRSWPLEQVNLITEIAGKENENLSNDGVILYGNFLEGAAWSYREGKLVECPRMQIMSEFPKVLMWCALRAGLDKQESNALPSFFLEAPSWEVRKEGHYNCPCYMSRKRTASSFVWAMQLRSDEPPVKWVVRGVAVTCTRE